MKIETPGWVVINIGHPRSGDKFIVSETFSRFKSDAIKKFNCGLKEDWVYWKKKYNYRVVRSTQSFTVSDSEF